MVNFLFLLLIICSLTFFSPECLSYYNGPRHNVVAPSSQKSQVAHQQLMTSKLNRRKPAPQDSCQGWSSTCLKLLKDQKRNSTLGTLQSAPLPCARSQRWILEIPHIRLIFLVNYGHAMIPWNWLHFSLIVPYYVYLNFSFDCPTSKATSIGLPCVIVYSYTHTN